VDLFGMIFQKALVKNTASTNREFIASAIFESLDSPDDGNNLRVENSK
jgi:hypothetical protein